MDDNVLHDDDKAEMAEAILEVFGEVADGIMGKEIQKCPETVQHYVRILRKRCEASEAEITTLQGELAWPKEAAEETLVAVLIARECDPDISAFTQSPSGKGYSHKIFMLRQIAAGQVIGTKAHRWLGYAQALGVVDGSMNLVKAKEINERARTALENK